MDINDLPLPSNEQIEAIAERVGSITLDTSDVNTIRLCSLIIWQDLQLEQLSNEQSG